MHKNRVFHKLDEIGNHANIGIRDFTTWKNPNLWMIVMNLTKEIKWKK